MTDEILDATPEQVADVVAQMVDLPWPDASDGDDWLEWEIDGLEGQTNYLLHVLPLAATTDAGALAAFSSALVDLADRRWVARFRFDATRFTDGADTPAASYDRRSAPAALVRSLGAEHALWWPLGSDAVVLVVGDAARTDDGLHKAAVLVLPAQWLSGPPVDEPQSPLLDDLCSGDGGRVLSAVWEVIGTRDPDVLAPLAKALPAIRLATDDLDLGGMLVSNRSNLDHALERIELARDGPCLCVAYPSHQLYDPEVEERRGHVEVVETVPNERQWVPDRVCRCCECGRRFRVEQGEYHYTWWKWRALDKVPKRRR